MKWICGILTAFQAPFFRLEFNIGFQQDRFPTPVPSGKAIFAYQKRKNVLQVSTDLYICNGRRRKVDRSGASDGGFLRKFGSHNLQTQAVLFRKRTGLQITSVHGELRAIHIQTK